MQPQETTEIEFTVEMKGADSEAKIRNSLVGHGSCDVDAKTGRVVVQSSTCWADLLSKIEETTGLRAALTGFGGQAAVSQVVVGSDDIKGVVRFTSPKDNSVNSLVIDGSIYGLSSDRVYQIEIHECGDLSDGCKSIGNTFGEANQKCVITSNENGRASFRITEDQFRVSDIIGRSIVVLDGEKRLACGVIARAAGVNQNFKRICACDGITLWDERNVPAAGGNRKTYSS